jgi:hypothetical protein
MDHRTSEKEGHILSAGSAFSEVEDTTHSSQSTGLAALVQAGLDGKATDLTAHGSVCQRRRCDDRGGEKSNREDDREELHSGIDN